MCYLVKLEELAMLLEEIKILFILHYITTNYRWMKNLNAKTEDHNSLGRHYKRIFFICVIIFFFFFKQDPNHKYIKKNMTYLTSWNSKTYVRPRFHAMDILNGYWLASNFWMSLRCRENYSLDKFRLPKVEARSLLCQAPLQLVVRLWPHNEDAPILNSHSEKRDVKKEVPCDINNVERDRETSSCWNKQWRCHHAHWGSEESRVWKREEQGSSFIWTFSLGL